MENMCAGQAATVAASIYELKSNKKACGNRREVRVRIPFSIRFWNIKK